MKKITCLLIVLVLGLLQGVCAQDTATTAALDRVNQEGINAYYAADYQIALGKWQAGLQQARALKNKQYISRFLTNLGSVYADLGQYPQAAENHEQALAITREIGDRRGEGNALGNLGNVYHKLGQYAQALEYHEQALAITREIGDRRGEGDILGNLGVLYKKLGQYPRALEYQEQALASHRELGDRRGEGRDLTNLGNVYRDLGQYARALEYYEQVLAITREIGDRRGEGTALSNLGMLYWYLGQYAQALEYDEQALAIRREIGDRRGEGGNLSNLGIVYNDLGQYARALEYHEQALAIKRELGDRQGEGDTLGNLGGVYQNLGQYAQALEYYEQALAIHREIGDRRGEGGDLTNLGSVYNNLGQYARALEFYEQALAIDREIGNRRGEGTALGNLGNVYDNLGQYARALELYEQALAINREIGDRSGEGRALGNLGSVYQNLGQYAQALEYYEQALAIHRELGDRSSEGRALTNLGSVYDNLGQYVRALELHEQALGIHRETGDRHSEGGTLGNLGGVYHGLGQYARALELYEQTLAIMREIGDRHNEGTALGNLGVLYWNLGQYARALEYHEQALAIMREIGDQHGEGAALGNLGNVYGDLGQYQDAYATFQDSMRIHEALGTLESLWLAQRGIAQVEVHLNQPESAITHYEQALDTVEALRTGLAEKEQKLSFIQNKLFIYDELIDLLQALHQTSPDKGYDRKALDIFERKQGRVFLEEMGQSGARLFAGLPEAISQRELDLENQFEQTRKQLVDERSKPITEQNKELIQNLEERENTLEAEQAALQEQIKTGYPDYYALRYPKPVSLTDLQQNVLQPSELLLVYGVMHEKTLLWLISPETMHLFTLPVGEEELQQQVAELRGSWKYEYQWNIQRGLVQEADPQHEPKPPSPRLSYALYSLLIPEEIRPLLTETHTLNIVPTGPLYALPFEALVTEPTPGPSQEGNTEELHYLIQDIPVSYFSSASLLKTLREAKTRRLDTARYPLLAFAHPVYEPTPNPSQEGNSGASLQVMRSQVYRDLMRGDFSELPETAEEVEEIATLLNAPKESDPLQLREDASRTKVFVLNADDRLDDYHYIIFATHGVLPGDVDRVSQPALVLSYPEQEGYLTMADVFQLQLNTKLVSLSACNTGGGEQVRGEGVMGLTRAFMYAGTPAIAVTLWSVESFSAKALDIGLFQHLKDGQPPAQALRSIKLRMLQGQEGDTYRSPYYWAPFVIFGDGMQEEETKTLSKEEIRILQEALTTRGYRPGPVDGIWGKKTEVALKTFQQDHNIAVTGILDKATQEKLTPTPPLTATPPPVLAPVASQEWRDPITGMEFVWIPSGCFQMGQTESEKGELIKDVGEEVYKQWFANGLPRHEVCLDGFWMGKYEVTNAQYRKWKRAHDSKDYEGHSLNGDTQPAVSVSWDEAKEFADWLTQQHGGKDIFRLPTEAEWEYAARAGTTTSRYWGADPNTACRYANVNDTVFTQTFPEVAKEGKERSGWVSHECDDGYAVTAPVGKFRPNAFELYDILGNVWEWCEDPWHENYQGAPTDGSVWSEGGDSNFRLLKGGSWGNVPRALRCAIRAGNWRDAGDNFVGLRLVWAAGGQSLSTPRPTATPTRTAVPRSTATPQPVLAPVAGQEWTDPVTDMEFVWIPSGCFQMGQTESEKGELIKDVGEEDYKKWFTGELPRHEVCLDGFWMGKYEVTNAQYRKWKRYHDSRDYEGHSLNGDTQPAVSVSWNKAKEFADWLTQQHGGKDLFRLPTEAEWEYAARAGTTTSRYWGADPNTACRYANVGDTVFEQTFPEVVKEEKEWLGWIFHDCNDGYAVAAPVGEFRPNAFELYDMLGNVWEWCEDPWHENYQEAPTDGSVWSEGGDDNLRVLKGGSWDNLPRNLRCAYRNRRMRGSDYIRGFRLVRAAGGQSF